MSAFKKHNITENKYFIFHILNKHSENLHQWTCISETRWLKSRKYINYKRKLQTGETTNSIVTVSLWNKHLVILKKRSANYFTGNCYQYLLSFWSSSYWVDCLCCLSDTRPLTYLLFPYQTPLIARPLFLIVRTDREPGTGYKNSDLETRTRWNNFAIVLSFSFLFWIQI